MPINLLLKCRDIAETQAYYRDVLGFTVRETAHGTSTAQKDDCALIFSDTDQWGSEPRFSGTIYCFIDDVDAYFQAVKDTTEVQWPLQEMDYGTREFAIKDNNGYTLAFAKA